MQLNDLWKECSSARDFPIEGRYLVTTKDNEVVFAELIKKNRKRMWVVDGTGGKTKPKKLDIIAYQPIPGAFVPK